MVNWESVRYFVALADTGTLSGAARLLNVEHATIARRVAALESETGLKLVDRRGRRFLLTEDGERIAAIARKMQDEAQAISRFGAVRDTGISATITLTAPPSYAVARLAKPLAAVSEQYPGIHMRVMGEARFSSLNRREADIAIRLTRRQPAISPFAGWARKLSALMRAGIIWRELLLKNGSSSLMMKVWKTLRSRPICLLWLVPGQSPCAPIRWRCSSLL